MGYQTGLEFLLTPQVARLSYESRRGEDLLSQLNFFRFNPSEISILPSARVSKPADYDSLFTK